MQNMKVRGFDFEAHSIHLDEDRRICVGVEISPIGWRRESTTSFPSNPVLIKELDEWMGVFGWHFFYDPDKNVLAYLCEPTADELMSALASQYNEILLGLQRGTLTVKDLDNEYMHEDADNIRRAVIERCLSTDQAALGDRQPLVAEGIAGDVIRRVVARIFPELDPDDDETEDVLKRRLKAIIHGALNP
jgi:hypothetical protein